MMNEKDNVDFESEFNIYNILKRLWDDRKLFATIVALFAVGSIIYSLVVPNEFEVSSTILPADASAETTTRESTPVMGFALTGYSHLPVINGIMITLKSDSFLELIYKKYEKDERLFKNELSEIDESEDSKEQKEYLKRYTALKILNQVIKFRINSDHNTVVLTIRLQDRIFAYEMMNHLLEALREYIRTQNIANLEDDIEFYQELVDKAHDPRIQQIIDQKLNDKLQKKFVLSANIFTIVDKPFIPAKRIFPRRSTIVVITTMVGSLFAFMILTLKPAVKKIFRMLK